MKFYLFAIPTVLAISIFFAACGGSGASDGSSNTNLTNTNTAAVTNSDNPLAVSTPTPEQTINNAPTLTPVYKAYCAAMVKKDEAALRRIYSSDTIAYFEKEMKADGVKSLLEYLSDDQVTNELCEVRNEQINGDRGVAEIRSKGYPNGIKVIFVKENGQWKLTNRSPEVPMQK